MIATGSSISVMTFDMSAPEKRLVHFTGKCPPRRTPAWRVGAWAAGEKTSGPLLVKQLEPSRHSTFPTRATRKPGLARGENATERGAWDDRCSAGQGRV